MTLIKREEYYVVYYIPSSLDTKSRRCTSLNFPLLQTAEEFMNSMLSQGATRASIEKQVYYYEE